MHTRIEKLYNTPGRKGRAYQATPSREGGAYRNEIPAATDTSVVRGVRGSVPCAFPADIT